MSHVTQKQAKKLKELGYPQLADTGAAFSLTALKELPAMSAPLLMINDGVETLKHPSAEELMEWLANEIGEYAIVNRITVWRVDGFEAPQLIDALYMAACWVLEGKNGASVDCWVEGCNCTKGQKLRDEPEKSPHAVLNVCSHGFLLTKGNG